MISFVIVSFSQLKFGWCCFMCALRMRIHSLKFNLLCCCFGRIFCFRNFIQNKHLDRRQGRKYPFKWLWKKEKNAETIILLSVSRFTVERVNVLAIVGALVCGDILNIDECFSFFFCATMAQVKSVREVKMLMRYFIRRMVSLRERNWATCAGGEHEIKSNTNQIGEI